MSLSTERLVKRLEEAEHDLISEVEDQQRRWHYRLERGRVWFDDEMRRAHRRLRQSIPAYVRTAHLSSLFTAPVIYSLIVPFALLDAWVSTYQWVCFPLYGIARVRRRDYFVIDRHKLAYLNGIEKLNCTFCSYTNGLVAYVREVAARTEQDRCPIKHANPIQSPHARYHLFFDYGDAESYRHTLAALRRTQQHERVASSRSQRGRGRRTH